MNMPGESHEFRSDIGDVEQYLRMQGIRGDIDTTFAKDAHQAIVIPVDDQFGHHADTILGGLVPIEAHRTDYTDITLVRREVLGRQLTSLVASGTEYEINTSSVTLADNPYHILIDNEVEKIRFWVSRKPPIAIWSLKASIRLAEEWRQSRVR